MNRLPYCFLILALLASSLAVAQQFPGYPPYGYPYQPGAYPPQTQSDTSQNNTPQRYQYQQPPQHPGMPQFRPPRSTPKQSNSSGMSSGSSRSSRQFPQGWPQQGGMPFQQPQQQRYSPPRVEASLSASDPFEQQSLVYTLRIISGGNLKTANPEPPRHESVVLRRQGEAVTYSRQTAGQQEMITEHQYILMPLVAGNITLPPPSASGTQTSGAPFSITGTQPLTLQVKPAAQGVQPWLPLYNLQIQAKLINAENPSAGNPITLEVEITAAGATGAQIPSIADQLESDSYRIYPTNSISEGRITPDNSALLGRKVETFTLVPQYGGWLSIPAVHLDWWNIRYDRREVASLPTRQLRVAGPEDPRADTLEAEGLSIIPEGANLLFWIPLMGAFVIVLFGWLRVLLGSGRTPGMAQVAVTLRGLLGDLYKPVATAGMKISPRRHFHRVRTWTGRNLPVSWKLWFCLRSVDKENDPEHWGHALQILASKHLGVRSHANLHHLGKSITACHPTADQHEVTKLMTELDQAIYGATPIASFTHWKKRFKQQIKPSLFPIRFKSCDSRDQEEGLLPRLNPSIQA